ncbi:MAG: condensation domain-containing protein, partial [Actinomycetes bacterium]
ECTEADLDAQLHRASEYGIDITTEIPLRPSLFRLGPDDHVLLLLTHHIATDEWSDGPLLGDLAIAYRARAAGQAPHWEPLPVSYADYTRWQQQLLGSSDDPSSVAGAQLKYWRSTLDGAPVELAWPSTRARPAAPSHRGATVLFSLSPQLSDGVRDLVRRSGTTPFMVMQAAVAVLAAKLGAGEDIPLGVPVAGRSDDALDGLVGFFVNTLVLRTDVSGNPTVTELLARVRSCALDAFAHQDIPFEQLVEALNPPRHPGRHPLFQVMVSYQHRDDVAADLDGIAVTECEIADASAKFDLAFDFSESESESDSGIGGVLQYATDLFDRPSAESLAERLRHILAGLVADPDRRLSTIDVLGTVERHAVLVEHNDTASGVPAHTFPEFFAQQVQARPGAVAVVCEADSLTYAELGAAANRVAQG